MAHSYHQEEMKTRLIWYPGEVYVKCDLWAGARVQPVVYTSPQQGKYQNGRVTL